MSSPVLTPPTYIPARKDPKLANNWKSKPAEQLTDAEVLAKKDAAETWCALATEHAVANGGKPWSYVLIPDTSIAENMTLDGLVKMYRK